MRKKKKKKKKKKKIVDVGSVWFPHILETVRAATNMLLYCNLLLKEFNEKSYIQIGLKINKIKQ